MIDLANVQNLWGNLVDNVNRFDHAASTSEGQDLQKQARQNPYLKQPYQSYKTPMVRI